MNNQKMDGAGVRIKRLRKERGLTQTGFARMIGRNFSTVSKLESGKLPLSGTILAAICTVFGVRRDWLVNGTGAKADDKWALLAARARELGEEVFLEFSRLKALRAERIPSRPAKAAPGSAIAEECAAKLTDILGVYARDTHKAQAVAKIIGALLELLKAGAPPGAVPKKKK